MSVVITNDMDDAVESTVVITMKKIENFFLVACGVCAIVLSACTIYKCSYDETDYATIKMRLKYAEQVIAEVEECWDSFGDTVAEGDSYCNWVELVNE